jgi:NhaP-type Na+/H+ or K+/H+ antiporter
MDTYGIVIIAAGVLGFSLVSGRLNNTILTAPMVFAAFGLAIGGAGLGLAQVDISHGLIHTLAEITLVLVLFSDAARIDLRLLLRDHNLPLRMLLIGMPLTIAAGTAVAFMLPLGLDFFHAALLAAVLAPTDAALGQSVVSNANVPVRIRQALNVESGLNDGIAVPVVVFLAALAAAGAGDATGNTYDYLTFGALQVILGPLTGIAVGCLGGWLIDAAVRRGWMSMSFEGAAVLAMAGIAFAGAELIGGNGFIAAFTAGLTFGYVIKGRCAFLLEFVESEGQLLTLITFLIFGAVMLPELADGLTWTMVLYAVGSLTVIRLIPVALSLIGTGVSGMTVLFLGWFGPRGLASALFGLLILEQLHTPQSETILLVTIVTIALSIVLHGLTAAPAAAAYGRMATTKGECAENQPASEMPTRTGYVTSEHQEDTP